MKKFLFLIAVCCLITTATKAQDVLNEIVKTSLSITNDTTLSREVRKAAVFKYDAMSFCAPRCCPQMFCWNRRSVPTHSTHVSRCSMSRLTP